jgi:myotubularin-related protein 6/7/8
LLFFKASLLELCCFFSNDHLDYLKDSKLSDKIFDLESEYARMGVPNMEWIMTNLNFNYQMCDTYPSRLYVPSSASNQIILGSASFRSRGRLAVLSYLNRNGASICRCSQPLAGFSARCLEDEKLLDCILKTNKNASYMYVVDTRPKINAMANKATGKGFENENYYANIQFYFFGIENIHVMRNSLQKLIESITCASFNFYLIFYFK